MNRQPVSMPSASNGIVMSNLDDHVTIDVNGHLHVEYVRDSDTYIIVMNGFYFGKTNGLLGSYDNEPSNDMVTSFGKPIDEADRYVKTWEVGTSRCR